MQYSELGSASSRSGLDYPDLRCRGHSDTQRNFVAKTGVGLVEVAFVTGNNGIQAPLFNDSGGRLFVLTIL